MTPRLVAASTAAMEAPASPAARVPSVCAPRPLLGLSVSIPLTALVIPTPATMAAHVNTRLRRRSTTASAPLTSTASDATSWITASREGSATTSHRRQRWRSHVTSRSARRLSTTSSATCSVTTMRAAGTTATAHSTSTTRGRTALPRCSAGDTSPMESAIHSVTTLDVSMTGLTARIWKDSASEWKCIDQPDTLLIKWH